MDISLDHMYNTSYSFYQKYVDMLEIDIKLKNILSQIKVTPYYYFYPQIFANAFKSEIDDNIKNLNIAGTLVFVSNYLHDRVCDGQIEKTEIDEAMRFVNFTHEQGSKILATIFPANTAFWKLWDKRKQDYERAAKLSLDENLANYDKIFEILADERAAFGKIAIDGAFLLAENNNKNSVVYENLLESMRLFNIAHQIYDDVEDIKEDFRNKQHNIAIYHVRKLCLEKEIDFNLLNEVMIEKYFYVFGIGNYLLNEALKNFESSLELVKQIDGNGKLWEQIIIMHQKFVQSKLTKLDDYLKLIQSRIDNSELVK